MSCKKNYLELNENMNYRQFFAKRWQAFIIENFSSPAHAAVCFGVSPTTAANWFDGYNAPQGWVVARAMTDPNLQQKAQQHLSGAPTCSTRYAAD